MGGVSSDAGAERRDFFISYAGPDRAWAEWVAWQLIEAGYTVELAVWDWAAGQNIVTAISDALERSDRVVALFSADYFDRPRYTTEEWTGASVHVSDTERSQLVPLQVGDLSAALIPRVLRTLVCPKIFGIPKEKAREVVLRAAKGPQRPDREPVYPGRGTPQALSSQGKSPPQLPGRFPSVWNIPARNPGFTGRDELLREVHDRLRAGEGTVVLALHGIGGVGKTQLATEYAHRFAGNYDLAWWITAEPPALIGDRFTELADELDCTESDAGIKRIQTVVLRKLRQRDGWLLVFDNAVNPGDLLEWLPSGNGHVLITSRTPHWGEMAAPAEIDVLARADSVAILRERVAGITETEADQLARQLGDLPLGLAQAASFMAESGTTAASYSVLLETEAAEILDEGLPTGSPKSLAAAIGLSADQLARLDPAAAELANLCAFLAPEPIPQELITSAAGELPPALASQAAEPALWGLTTRQLGRSALARIGPGQLQMHRLTQAILRSRLDPDQAIKIRNRSEAILAYSDPEDPANPDTWPRWVPLMPHLLAADLAGTDNPALRSAACHACGYLLARGDANRGHDLANRLYQSWRIRPGADHPDTLAMAHYLAWALGSLGHHGQARELGENTLERRCSVLGENHPDTLATASNLIASLEQLGEQEAARLLAEDTWERSCQALGEDDLRTLVAAVNLAGVLWELGQIPAARKHLEYVFERRRLLLEEDHPSTLTAAGNVAAIRRAAGELQTARELGEDTLSRMRRVLGKDHPITLATAMDLAATMCQQGEEGSAQKLARKTLNTMRRVLGKEHPTTVIAEREWAAGSNAGKGS